MVVPVPHPDSLTRWSPRLEQALPEGATALPLRPTSAGSANA